MAGAARPSDSQGRFEVLAFRTAPLAVFAGLAVAGVVAGPTWSARVAAWPWILSLVLVGLPHGAADLAVARRLCTGPGAVAALFVAYIGVMALAGFAFAVMPLPVLLAFVALSGWHFGAAHADAQSPPIEHRPGSLALGALARGAPVLGMPLAAWPEASARVAATVAALAGASPTIDPATVRTIGTALVVAGIVCLAIEAWRTRRDPGGPARSRATLVDLAVICGLEATTDPLFAIGCYFLGWHAWRQMRLLAPAVAGGPVDGPGSLATALGRIHLAALPLLVPTLAALAAAWWWLPAANLPRSPCGLAILSLAVYVVVTPSHDLLMGGWRSRGGGGQVRPW